MASNNVILLTACFVSPTFITQQTTLFTDSLWKEGRFFIFYHYYIWIQQKGKKYIFIEKSKGNNIIHHIILEVKWNFYSIKSKSLMQRDDLKKSIENVLTISLISTFNISKTGFLCFKKTHYVWGLNVKLKKT